MAVLIDARELKRKLAGTGPDASVNCAIVSDGHEAHIAVDKVRAPQKLLAELTKELDADGFHTVKKYFGTAFADAYPGVLMLTLNKPAPSGIRRLLRLALRGSGYRQVKMTGTDDDGDSDA